MKTLKKSEINFMLEQYQSKPKEFEKDPKRENTYKSQSREGYWITLEKKDNDIIHVSYTKRSGERPYTDIWQYFPGISWTWVECEMKGRMLFTENQALKDENKKLKEQIVLLTNELNTQKEKKIQKLSKRVGRPKETERIDGVVEDIRKLKSDGRKDKEIMQRLNLTKPTFYRYKRLL